MYQVPVVTRHTRMEEAARKRQPGRLLFGYVATIIVLASLVSTAAFGPSGLLFLLVPAVFGPIFFGTSNMPLFGSGLAHELQSFLRWPERGQVVVENFPGYRYVDLYEACQRLAATAARPAIRLDFTHDYLISFLLRVRETIPKVRAAQQPFARGPGEQVFLPIDQFWLLTGLPGSPEGGGAERLILRLRFFEHPLPRCNLELAGLSLSFTQQLAKRLSEESLTNSLYRGQNLEIRCDLSADMDGDAGYRTGDLQLVFKPKGGVGEEDIVLDDGVRALLQRVVIDFHRNRDALARVGLPRKRALLFYGPPGVGKTFTCQFLQTKLDGVTSFHVAGSALTKMQEIGKLARALKPALVILEDVDLVFSQRETNAFSTILGDFMDLLDGIPSDEEVFFILTTNAIERVEQAIRDRPGRINQCVFFEQPGPALRRRYLQRFLQPYDAAGADLDKLVKQTDQASQAFLKEYILRAVQIACGEKGYPSAGAPPLLTRHFEEAYQELAEHGNKHSRAILGFANP